MRIQNTWRGCYSYGSTVPCCCQQEDRENRSLKQRNFRGRPTTLESEPIAGAGREQAHGPTFPKTEREREDVADQVDELLQRECEERFGLRGRR